MKRIIAAAALAVAATAATAQQPPAVAAAPNATLDPEAVAAARELMLETGADKQVGEMAQRAAQLGFDEQLDALQRHVGRAIPPELRATLQAVLHAHVEEITPDLRAALLDEGAKTYARYFTAAEIRELQRLQTNPVMVKFRSVGAAFMTDLMQIGVNAAKRHDAELDAALKAVIDKWEADHKPVPPPRHG
ncbi:MAG: uncharacterized protein QOG84_467 [Sphingomonadales bacterium]|jgi:hypothetical protein|nr:uncharacterized protein [Sphingomonadales bacterium]